MNSKIADRLLEVNRIYWNEIASMAKQYDIDRWELIKITHPTLCGQKTFDRDPNFAEYIGEEYIIHFAYTVINGMPVFQGDEIFFRNKKVKVIGISSDKTRLIFKYVDGNSDIAYDANFDQFTIFQNSIRTL